jgi:hypothetical protein
MTSLRERMPWSLVSRSASTSSAAVPLRRVGVLGGFLGSAITAALLMWKLAPESAPVARGQEAVVGKDCLQCHGIPAIEGMQKAPLAYTNPHSARAGQGTDLLAYFEAVRVLHTFRERSNSMAPSRLLEGERLARTYRCFQCHGELGQGGFENAGSLKGYVPGFFGSDFDELTSDGNEESVRAWIAGGWDSALYEHWLTGPIVEYFLSRQEVPMPSHPTIPAAELDVLVEYVLALRQYGPMGVDEVRAYERHTEGSHGAGAVNPVGSLNPTRKEDPR